MFLSRVSLYSLALMLFGFVSTLTFVNPALTEKT